MTGTLEVQEGHKLGMMVMFRHSYNSFSASDEDFNLDSNYLSYPFQIYGGFWSSNPHSAMKLAG